MNAKDHLEINGRLFVVIRKEQGAKSLIKDLQENGYNVDVLEKKLHALPEACFEEVSNFLDYILFKAQKETKEEKNSSDNSRSE